MATRLSSGDVAETLWVNPAVIEFKIAPTHDLKGIAAGNWDVERRYPLAEAVKHRAIWQRYRDGARWEETDLFSDTYRRRFDAGDTVRGEPTWDALVAQYYERVDGMFAAMKRDGFNACAGPLPNLFIGRDGDVFIGNQGNHRLAMAQVLGLKKFAGRIICRHKKSRR